PSTCKFAVSDPAVMAAAGFVFSAVEGLSTASQSVATFTEPAGLEPNPSDPSGTINNHYSASINWGDGSPATVGTLSLSGNTISVAGGHTYAEEGTFTITVTISHEGSTAQTATSTATVSDPAVVGMPVNVSAA